MSLAAIRITAGYRGNLWRLGGKLCTQLPRVRRDPPGAVVLRPDHGAAAPVQGDLLAVGAGPCDVPVAGDQGQPVGFQHGSYPDRQGQAQRHEAGQGAADIAVGAGRAARPAGQHGRALVLGERRLEVSVAERGAGQLKSLLGSAGGGRLDRIGHLWHLPSRLGLRVRRVWQTSTGGTEHHWGKHRGTGRRPPGAYPVAVSRW